MSNASTDKSVLEILFESGVPYIKGRQLAPNEVIILQTTFPKGVESRNQLCKKRITYERIEEVDARSFTTTSYTKRKDNQGDVHYTPEPVHVFRVCDEEYYLKHGHTKTVLPKKAREKDAQHYQLAKMFKTGTPIKQIRRLALTRDQIIVVKLKPINGSKEESYDTLSDLELARQLSLGLAPSPFGEGLIALYRVCPTQN